MNFEKRTSLILFLEELSSRHEQVRLWLNQDDFPNIYGIDEVYHFFFDDTDLGDDPFSEIGNILANSYEAEHIQKLCKKLIEILDRLGDANSDVFMNDHQWQCVMSIAQDCLTLINKP